MLTQLQNAVSLRTLWTHCRSFHSFGLDSVFLLWKDMVISTFSFGENLEPGAFPVLPDTVS